MGNSKSSRVSPLKKQWGSDNMQTFMVKAHKNKIFGCDVIIPSKDNPNEIWIASCSADGKLFIHEVLIETLEEKQNRQKILSQQTHSSLTKSKSLSSTQHKGDINLIKKSNKKTQKPFEIEINRLFSIPLDSTYCYTLSLHFNCRYVSTSIDKSLFIFEVDFNTESPIYTQVKIAKKYISGAKFIDDKHIIFCSGDGNVYIYNFIDKELVSTITYNDDDKNENNDILCFDHGVLGLKDHNTFGGMQKQLIVFATLDGNVLIYDITDIIKHDFDAKTTQKNNNDGILLQTMIGHFGAEISCISMSDDGKFIVVGSEDNTYNIYCISILNGNDIKWVLLHKQIVINDANINHVEWINNKTMIASCDKGKNLYLSGIYDIRDCRNIIDLLLNSIKISNNIINDGLDHIIKDIIDIMLEYVMWAILHYEMNVDFEEHISCIATCSDVNNGAGFIVVGGFSKLLQCFLPLQ